MSAIAVRVTLNALLICTTSSFALASHSHIDLDFDDGFVGGGWSHEQLASDPFGGFYLGPFDSGTVHLLLMDALPAFNAKTGTEDYAARNFRIAFDLVSFGGLFTVVENENELFSDLVFPSAAENYRTHFSFDTTLDARDVMLQYVMVSPLPWGLDNVLIDWSWPVPEPSTFTLAGLDAVGILAGGLRRRHALQQATPDG